MNKPKINSNNSYLNKFKKIPFRNNSQTNLNYNPIDNKYKLNDNPSYKYNVTSNKGANKMIPNKSQKLNYLINNQNKLDINTSYDMHVNTNRLNSSMNNSNNSTSRVEKEMQRKVKTILKKDILGRYRKSTYIKSFAISISRAVRAWCGRS